MSRQFLFWVVQWIATGKWPDMTDRDRAKERALWADILMAYDSSRGENYVNRYSENPVWGNTETVAEFIPIMKKSITSS